jgi:hypothetical protein
VQSGRFLQAKNVEIDPYDLIVFEGLIVLALPKMKMVKMVSHGVKKWSHQEMESSLLLTHLNFLFIAKSGDTAT